MRKWNSFCAVRGIVQNLGFQSQLLGGVNQAKIFWMKHYYLQCSVSYAWAKMAEYSLGKLARTPVILVAFLCFCRHSYLSTVTYFTRTFLWTQFTVCSSAITRYCATGIHCHIIYCWIFRFLCLLNWVFFGIRTLTPVGVIFCNRILAWDKY